MTTPQGWQPSIKDLEQLAEQAKQREGRILVAINAARAVACANYTQALIFNDNFEKSRKTGSISPNGLGAAGKTFRIPSTPSRGAAA